MVSRLRTPTPPRHDVRWVEEPKLADETQAVRDLLANVPLSDAQLAAVEGEAAQLVEAFRARPKLKTRLDAFLQEYGLETEEGVALMCLAESLLRVPDKATRDDLIADKLSPGDWQAHLGESEDLLVNASSLGLLLTGRVVRMGEDWGRGGAAGVLGRLTHRLGEPVIRASVARAMKILGGEFVLGETMPEAIRRGRREFGGAQLYSFDMLGEGARTWADADRYLDAYHGAVSQVAAMNERGDVTARSGISVKLSALHPRYTWSHRAAVIDELVPRVAGLAQAAREAGVKLTLDAEEADRLGLSLYVFEAVARQLPDGDWPGFGLAIQAYGKRARRVIAWVSDLARELDTRFMVRLVKGAYWDAEIKHAQEQGWEGFPVFTRKSSTDLSYLVCAGDMLANADVLFSQFATHNAHTVAAIMTMRQGKTEHFEFQRLHGMGEGIYAVAAERYADMPPVRIYAPVGGHRDLLAYLVRRLLENGANSSFVNRFLDADVPALDVVSDPVETTRALDTIPHPAITPPPDLFQPRRDNADGLDLSDPFVTEAFEAVQADVFAQSFTVASLCAGGSVDGAVAERVVNPANHGDTLGHATPADPGKVGALFTAASKAQPGWDARGGSARAAILRRAADALEADTMRLMAVLVREAGKTRDDALAEVREAVDFLRYYAAQAEAEFGAGEVLPGPTGERNTLHLAGRGTFVCIAPWNFPLAIFIGQVAAALAAGNAAVAKPAEQTPIIASLAVQALHSAGVPDGVVQLALGGGAVGAALVEHPGFDGVAFTGGTDTARLINRTLAEREGPIVPLIAETGGLNAMFVDSTALLEQVTDDVIASAFLSAGQRCSALRVLFLQDDIADAALDLIRGAMDTLTLGQPREYSNDVGPIIDARAKAVLTEHIAAMKAKGFAHHSVGEADALPGTFVAPHLFEVGSMADVPGERFGPVLHVIRWKADALDAALANAFSSGFGLTLGVHTRMDSRWREIFERAPVGNTYVNRNMVGAVVGSQPFGGQGLSGTGFKAGGPRYLYRFAHEKTLSVNTMASGGNTELLQL